MNRNPWVAGVLSLLVPGLGQIYAGMGDKGAAILAAAVVIGNLHIIFLRLFVAAEADPSALWSYWVPRVGHDIMSLWSVAFWIWAVADARRVAARRDPSSPQ